MFESFEESLGDETRTEHSANGTDGQSPHATSGDDSSWRGGSSGRSGSAVHQLQHHPSRADITHLLAAADVALLAPLAAAPLTLLAPLAAAPLTLLAPLAAAPVALPTALEAAEAAETAALVAAPAADSAALAPPKAADPTLDVAAATADPTMDVASETTALPATLATSSDDDIGLTWDTTVARYGGERWGWFGQGAGDEGWDDQKGCDAHDAFVVAV